MPKHWKNSGQWRLRLGSLHKTNRLFCPLFQGFGNRYVFMKLVVKVAPTSSLNRLTSQLKVGQLNTYGPPRDLEDPEVQSQDSRILELPAVAYSSPAWCWQREPWPPRGRNFPSALENLNINKTSQRCRNMINIRDSWKICDENGQLRILPPTCRKCFEAFPNHEGRKALHQELCRSICFDLFLPFPLSLGFRLFPDVPAFAEGSWSANCLESNLWRGRHIDSLKLQWTWRIRASQGQHRTQIQDLAS